MLLAARNIGRRFGYRVLETVLVVVIIVIITNLLTRLLPGDPALTLLGVRATPERLAALRHQLGLDVPVWTQIGHSLLNAAQGDLGTSIREARPVSTIILEALPITLVLIVGAALFSAIAGLVMGLLPTLRRSALLERGIGVLSVVMLAIPPFVLGLYAILVLSLSWGIAPPGGWAGSWPGNLRYAWLPMIVLGVMMIPPNARAVQRACMGTLNEEYIEAARVRGVSPVTLALRHVLPNVLIPLITLTGLNISAMLGGAVIVEVVFGIPGFGGVVMTAVTSRDYPVIQGCVLVAGVFVILVNLLTDMLYAVADPRVRLQR